MVVVVGTLFNFFSKVYLTHFFKNKSENEMMSGLKVRHSFFLKDYKLAARNYPFSKSKNVIFIHVSMQFGLINFEVRHFQEAI